jgi:catechol 2,3-dioxygenase-like lactoylglutathione lyase family enzyme
VGRAVDFYTGLLGFELDERFGDAMAIVRRGDLVLWLAGPAASASRPMPDGRAPRPGGWNRIVIQVEDLAAEVDRLRAAGARFRNDVVSGPGGSQILIDDPAGNPVELFQAAR